MDQIRLWKFLVGDTPITHTHTNTFAPIWSVAGRWTVWVRKKIHFISLVSTSGTTSNSQPGQATLTHNSCLDVNHTPPSLCITSHPLPLCLLCLSLCLSVCLSLSISSPHSLFHVSLSLPLLTDLTHTHSTIPNVNSSLCPLSHGSYPHIPVNQQIRQWTLGQTTPDPSFCSSV